MAARSTVWPVGGAGLLPGTGGLPGWLGLTILTLAIRHTVPGDRVLLLTPPPRQRSTASSAAGVVNGWFGPDPYAELRQACWTLHRLGRDVLTDLDLTRSGSRDRTDRTQFAAGDRSDRGSSPHPATTESESGLRPAGGAESQTASPTTACRAPVARHRGRPFDLIVTAAHPEAAGWLRNPDWTGLLTATGLLSVVTHSAHRGGVSLDPVSGIVSTLSDAGLVWFDHIALLDEEPTLPGGDATDVALVPAAVRDLLLFVPRSGPQPVQRSSPDPDLDRERQEATTHA